MNRRKLLKDRFLVWSLISLLIGLMMYSGYQSTVSNTSANVDVSQAVMNQSAYEESPHTPQNINQQEQSDKIVEERPLERELELVFGQTKGVVAQPLELKDFPCPVEGTVIRNVGNYYSKVFENYIFHAGQDYALLEGTVIRATRRGNVVFAGPDALLGQKVTLDCGEGWFVTYGGLDNLRVQEGEVVETQRALGQIGFFPGAEGESDQPQLHYEVWHNGQVQKWPKTSKEPN